MICLCLNVLLLLGFAAPIGAFAEEQMIENSQQLLDFLAVQRENGTDQIDFSCTPAFYQELQEDSFRLLTILCIKSGINDPRISYLDSRCAIRLSYVEFTDQLWAECYSEEDVRSAILQFTAEKAESFLLLCPPQLCSQLYGNSHVDVYAAQGGALGYMYVTYSTELGIVRAKNIEYKDVPYAVVEDYAQFALAIKDFENRGLTDFTICFSPELFSLISSNKEERRIMEVESNLEGYSVSGMGNNCTLHYYSVTYTNVPRLICRSQEDVVETIRRMGSAGITEFELIFLDKSLYDVLAENDFAVLGQLQAKSGMSQGQFSYSFSGDRIHFTDAVIVSDVVALESMEQAVSYVEEQVDSGAKEISLFCTQELYENLMGDLTERFSFFHSGMNRIYDLISHAGICDFSLSTSSSAGVITIHVEKLFPGTAIVMASRSGDNSALNDREMSTWTTAAEVADACRSEDPLETAKAIHDWLCENNSYVNDEETDEDDTAIGAILNGEANCDGYTDAFYLIGTLAGLEVRYQHGDSYNKGMFDFGSPVTHIWNLLRIDGEWRMVDVTWDDDEDGPCYIWFNVGMDMASRLHFWNEDMTVSLAADTNRRYFGEGEYEVSTEDELHAAFADAASHGWENLSILFADPDLVTLHEDAVNSLSKLCRGVFRYSWEDHMLLLRAYDLSW